MLIRNDEFSLLSSLQNENKILIACATKYLQDTNYLKMHFDRLICSNNKLKLVLRKLRHHKSF